VTRVRKTRRRERLVNPRAPFRPRRLESEFLNDPLIAFFDQDEGGRHFFTIEGPDVP